MKTDIYLSIGSNLGDRRDFIRRALDALLRLGEIQSSEVYINTPDGFGSPNEFANIAAILTIESQYAITEKDAITYLTKFQAIEKEISPVPHRESDGSYRDREIDIDIIAIEGIRMSTDTLTLPHPRASSRDFVMKPLSELVGFNKAKSLVE